MGKIILEEQTTASTPASNKVAIYPKAGGGIYKIADDGVEGQLATTSYIDTQISGVDEHSEMLGLTIGDDHTQYILVDGTRAFTGNIQANASGTLDIGSLSLPFKDLYLTGSSLYINGDKVLYMSGNDLVLDSPSGNVVISGGVDLSNADIQHGALDGLSDNDHTQYVTGVSGSTPLRGGGQTLGFDSTVIDHGSISGLSDDDHEQYINDTEMTTISGDLVTQLHTQSHAITSTADHSGGNWKVAYSNGSGEWVELALGASGTVLTSHGVSVAPVFE